MKVLLDVLKFPVSGRLQEGVTQLPVVFPLWASALRIREKEEFEARAELTFSVTVPDSPLAKETVPERVDVVVPPPPPPLLPQAERAEINTRDNKGEYQFPLKGRISFSSMNL
jgi:hypothetical protein